MTIIVGLGNPGKKFESTRHNAGFMVVDFFAAKDNFPEFQLSKKYESLISEKDGVILAKPQTFMNESGRAVKNLLNNKEAPLIVVNDDIDIPLGKFKISKDSGAGGHKGVDSTIVALGTKDFARIKIGVATNDQKAEEVVLQNFSLQEQETLNEVIKQSAEALKKLIDEGLEKAMNEYNK